MISCEPDHPRVSPCRHTYVNTHAERSHPRGLSSNCSLFKELDPFDLISDKDALDHAADDHTPDGPPGDMASP